MNLPVPINDATRAQANERSTEVFELAGDPLLDLVAEYRVRRDRMAEDKKWLEAFKAALAAKMGDNKTEVHAHGQKVAGFRHDGVFAVRRFEKEQGDLYQQYIVPVYENRFDEEKFKNDHPELHERYRGRSLRLAD